MSQDLLRYLVIPYEHKGRSFSGADCFGLMRLYYEHELGVSIPDYTKDYSEDWWTEQNLILDLYATYNFTHTTVMEQGTVLLFNNTSFVPGHIGIVIDDSDFIHMTRNGVGINNYRYGMWKRQFHSAYRLVL